MTPRETKKEKIVTIIVALIIGSVLLMGLRSVIDLDRDARKTNVRQVIKDVPRTTPYSGEVVESEENKKKHMIEGHKNIDISFRNRNLTIYGSLLIPNAEDSENKNPPPVVVIMPSGENGMDRNHHRHNSASTKSIAKNLADQGIASFRYDPRELTHIDFLSRASLIMEKYTIYDLLIDDAVLAIKTISKRDDIDPDRLYIAGQYFGGNQLPRVIEKTDTKIAGAIVLSGHVTPLHILFLDQEIHSANSDGKLEEGEKRQISIVRSRKNFIEHGGYKKKKDFVRSFYRHLDFWQSIEGYDPRPLVKDQADKIPYLFISGGRDFMVPPKEFDLWKDQLEGLAEFEFFEDLNHAYVAGTRPSDHFDLAIGGKLDIRVTDRIAEFIKNK